MMTGRRLTNAPHVKNQSKSPFDEVIILAGADAWNAYGKDGSGVKWQLISQAIKPESDYKPIILGESQLADIPKLQIVPKGKKIASIYQTGELKEAYKTALCANLAQFSAVETLALYGEDLGLAENQSDYLQRLREDEEAIKQAQIIAKSSIDPNAPKNEPYIELDTNGSLSGLFYKKPIFTKNGDFVKEDRLWLCDPLELVGTGKDESANYFYIFKWQNQDETQPRIEAVNCGEFGTETAWRLLKNKGLKMTPRTQTQFLVEHFHAQSADVEKWSVTNCTGWHKGAYLLPSGEIIGEPKEPIIFKNKSANANGYETKGSLASWQAEIARYTNKNTSMMLAIATALTSPILRLVNADSFGVHLFNSSTKGKTTALNVANSVYGDPTLIDLSWNTTPHALNNEANSRNDGFITLDELGQAKRIHDVENIAYSLFNEKGRAQGMKEGGNNELSRWKITALSTGEKDVEGFLKSKGLDINAGQLVRLLNIPLIEADHLHGFDNNKAHADHLNEASKNNFGVIGREWIRYLTTNKETVRAEYKRLNQVWQNRIAKNSASQVQRVASRFALLETALQLSTPLTLWDADECRECLIKSFNDWLADYGNGDREEVKILEFFNGWLDENAESMFIQIPKSEHDRAIRECYGYRILEIAGQRKEHFYIYPKSFNQLIVDSNFPKKSVLHYMEKFKMIKPGKEQEKRPFQHKATKDLEKLFNTSGKRFYILYPYLIEDDE